LTYFPNLKSIIISSPYGFSEDQLRLIFESKYFTQLHTFKIKEKRIYSNKLSYQFLVTRNIILTRHYVLENVLTDKSMLKTFHYLSATHLEIFSITYQNNVNLRSLKLILSDFLYIFVLISYTPNLEYLNVHCRPPWKHEWLKKTNIKLKEFYLKLDTMIDPNPHRSPQPIDFDSLTNSIKQFSSSLTCLSLDLVDLSMQTIDDFFFDSTKLRQLLEPINELKRFHLYVKPKRLLDNKEILLSRFQDQYWFDHNWSFGMHGKYFYTLPFHFDYLHEFHGGFKDVKSNHSDILMNNDRVWYNIKHIDLFMPSKYNFNFLKQLKIKMPKLTFINFNLSDYNGVNKTESIYTGNNKREKVHVTLDNVTTIKCIKGSLQDEKEWLIHALPNLKHLILFSTQLPSVYSELTPILNQRIKKLDLYEYSSLEPLTQISYFYFLNIQHISVCIPNTAQRRIGCYADNIMVILKNFKSLQTLMLYTSDENYNYFKALTKELRRLIQLPNKKETKEKYQMNQFYGWILFSKKRADNDKIQSSIFLSSLKKWW
jgi:hypothetical protein